VLVTGLSDLQDRLKGIEAGADEFLSKPVHPLELRARVGSLTRMKHLLDALDSAEAAFMTLALTIEARDPTTNGHCERLARHAVALGKASALARRISKRSIVEGSFTMWARSACRMRCCSRRGR
jgi:DNA-binding response OmpR family regulator